MTKTRNWSVALLLFSAFTAKPVEAGTTLRLSDLSSDETKAADLSATLMFAVDGGELALTVTNDTVPIEGFDLDAIYFNSMNSVSELLLSPPLTGWSLLRNQRADGFGIFDYALLTDLGNDPAEIGPTESVTFVFEITGIGPFADTNFTTAFSAIPPGEHEAIAAGKFVNGPGDDSAFGAVIPEPGTALLLLFGSAIAGRRLRRRSASPGNQ